MSAAPLPEHIDEFTVTEARKILGDLAQAAASGRVIHLTKHGRRIAKIVPESTQLDVNEAFVDGARKIIERNREMFDRLAEL
jgi:prevent-host-death family protein